VHVLKKVTKSAGGILILFRKDKKLAMLANGGIEKRKIKQLKIRYSKNVIFIVPDYSVVNGLENFVLIMMRKDHDEIESGLCLELACIKKIIQDSARLCGVYLEVNSTFTHTKW
jgi:hypothetical protein